MSLHVDSAPLRFLYYALQIILLHIYSTNKERIFIIAKKLFFDNAKNTKQQPEWQLFILSNSLTFGQSKPKAMYGEMTISNQKPLRSALPRFFSIVYSKHQSTLYIIKWLTCFLTSSYDAIVRLGTVYA